MQREIYIEYRIKPVVFMADIRRTGELTIRLKDANGNSLEKPSTFLIRENRKGGEFYTLKSENGNISTELPAGVYSFQAIAEGHNVGSGIATISPGSSRQVGLTLLE